MDSEDKKLKSKAFYNIARILQDKNEAEHSLAYYRKSLELNPSDIDAKINYELLKNQISQNKEQKDGEGNENNDSKNDEEQQQDGQGDKDKDKNDDRYNAEEDDSSKNEDNKNNMEESNSNDHSQSQEQDEAQRKEKNQSEQNENKSDDLMQVEAILNALKDQEKINQKQKILKTKSFKFDKDW